MLLRSFNNNDVGVDYEVITSDPILKYLENFTYFFTRSDYLG